MRYYIGDKVFTIRDQDAKEAIRIGVEVMDSILKQCKVSHTESFYPVFLLSMRLLCQSSLDILGVDGLVALLSRAEYTGNNRDDILFKEQSADEIEANEIFGDMSDEQNDSADVASDVIEQILADNADLQHMRPVDSDSSVQ